MVHSAKLWAIWAAVEEKQSPYLYCVLKKYFVIDKSHLPAKTSSPLVMLATSSTKAEECEPENNVNVGVDRPGGHSWDPWGGWAGMCTSAWFFRASQRCGEEGDACGISRS